MTRVFTLARILLFCLFSFSTTVTAENTPETCRAHYTAYLKNFSARLTRMENAYARYRWVEAAARREVYLRLWQARIDGNDPLDKQKRETGQREEKRLKENLIKAGVRSQSLVKLFFRDLEALERSDSEAPSMCGLPEFRTCLLKANEPVISLLEECRKAFSEILGHDREYLAVVLEASGGQDGLYPQDALEPEVEHSDMFWRFESPRAQERFHDDGRMADLFLEIRKTLAVDFPGDQCCFTCV